MNLPVAPAPWRVELALDGCARTTVGPRRWGAYFVCGFTGYLAGLALVMVLSERLGLGMSTRLVEALAPPFSLLLAIKVTQIVFGYERIVFYEKAILAVATTTLGGWLTGAPVATMLDLGALGMGTFLVFGRIGCFRVACCHGRRARRGVAYRDEHADAGFPARWVGHRLFPLQLVDSALAAVLVVTGVAIVVGDGRPGAAAVVYACGYGVGRFAEELVRGDAVRPIGLGLSEAQWTALATATAAAAWQPTWWSVAAAALLAVASAALIVARRRDRLGRLWLLAAHHLVEVADRVDGFARGAAAPVTTSLGLRLSGGRLPDGRLDVIVSRPAGRLAEATVVALAGQLGRPWTGAAVVAGRTPGLYHLILSTGDAAAAAPAPASASTTR